MVRAVPIPSSTLTIHAEDGVYFPRTVSTTAVALIEDQAGGQTYLLIDPVLGLLIEDENGTSTYLEPNPSGDLPLEDESNNSAPLLVSEI